MTAVKTSKASGNKKGVVREVSKLLVDEPIVGVISMEGLPAAQQQKIKAQLREHVHIYMTKIPLMRLAVRDASKKRPDISKLEPFITGMTALLFTKESPFKLYKIIKRNKSPAFAKPGQRAPMDIVVRAGPTSFAPGPIIGEFGSLGIKAGIDGGKVVIKQDSVVAKEGAVISAPLASMLARLDIKPVDIGLNVRVIFEDGVLYDKSVLDVDESLILSQMSMIVSTANVLSVELGIINRDNIDSFIARAFMHARGLAKDACIVTLDNVGDVLAVANAQAVALRSIEKL